MESTTSGDEFELPLGTVVDCLETVNASVLESISADSSSTEMENEVIMGENVCNENETLTVNNTQLHVESSESPPPNNYSRESPHNNTSSDEPANVVVAMPDSESNEDYLSDNIEDKNKHIETESVEHNFVENGWEENSLCNELESSSENIEFEREAAENKISFMEDKLIPCFVILERCKIPTESRSSEKGFDSTAYKDQSDIISVMDDTDTEVKKKSKNKKTSGSKLSKYPVKRKRSEHPESAIKGNSKIRKKYSKVFENTSDVSSESDYSPVKKKNIKVSALVHEPPKTNGEDLKNGRDNTNSSDSPISSSNGYNYDKIDSTIDLDVNLDSKKTPRRKRNPSSVSSMDECTSSNRRVITPRLRDPSSVQSEMIDTESCGSDRDVSGSGFPVTIETPKKQKKPQRKYKSLPDDFNLKPCQVVLSRCDYLNGTFPSLSSDADGNGISQLMVRSEESFSELPDTDDADKSEGRKLVQSRKKKSGMKKTKKSLPSKNKSEVMSEIKELKRMMARVDKKMDHLIQLISNSD